MMNKNVCFIHLKNWYSSFYYLIFEDAEIVFSYQDLVLSRNVVMEKESIFKKQCKYYPSASAEAQSKGIIFLFAYWYVSDCFY